MPDVTNLAMGPGTLYTAPFGGTEPADTAVGSVPTAPWVDAGGTLGGMRALFTNTYTALRIDQTPMDVGSRLTNMEFLLNTTLAEVTLENLAAALNNSAGVQVGSGFKSWEPVSDNSATQPTYKAILFDGWGPNQFRRRIISRRVLSIAAIELPYTADGQAVYAVSFKAHWVSASVKPYKLVDQTA